MTTLANGSTITKITTQPSSGCIVCRLHRRGTNESKSNGTTEHYLIEGMGAICGDCGQIIKAMAS